MRYILRRLWFGWRSRWFAFWIQDARPWAALRRDAEDGHWSDYGAWERWMDQMNKQSALCSAGRQPCGCPVCAFTDEWEDMDILAKVQLYYLMAGLADGDPSLKVPPPPSMDAEQGA